MDRKGFIQTLGRYLLLSILGVMSVFLVKNRRVTSDSCQESKGCKACGLYHSCNRPERKIQVR
jgi:hypothetical protein